MAFQYPRRIYLGDTDAAGVVYFARGMEICHEAYEESLARSGISLNQMLSDREIALPIVRAEIDFLRPLFCGDRLQIDLKSDLVNSSEFIVSYRIFNVEHLDRVLVKAQTRHVCINPQLRTRVDLPLTIHQWLEQLRQESF